MNILCTGGCGFIGSNFIRQIINKPEVSKIVNVDCLTYAGDLDNLGAAKDHPKHVFIRTNIRSAGEMISIMRKHRISHVIHMAAESHVDRSIAGPIAFIETNVRGTFNLLEACRVNAVERFLHVSTDEVYGSISIGSATEYSPLNPSSPYSASKAAADMLCLSYYKTYGTPIIITRCVNNYGPNQYPEKLIPVVIKRALALQSVPVYGDGSNVRDWIHVEDHCKALYGFLRFGQLGSIFNIAGGNEISNLSLVKKLCRLCEAEESLIQFVPDRPGHDQRYSVTSSVGRSGSYSEILFYTGLQDTVEHYRKKFASDQYTTAAPQPSL